MHISRLKPALRLVCPLYERSRFLFRPIALKVFDRMSFGVDSTAATAAPPGEQQFQFPAAGLVPKRETGVASLSTLYPECDGRGVVIAVLDSAVDLAAAGLQKTSDGRVKVIDVIDATGSGDVDMSHVATLSGDRTLAGLTGRTLTVPSDWQCPSGEFRLGVKPLYHLYPERLRKRVAAEYRDKQWTRPHAAALAASVARQQELAARAPANVNSGSGVADGSGSGGGEARLDREDSDERVDTLATLDKQYRDAGPSLDCIVFHDGQQWCSCVDTSLSGDLSQCRLMRDYRVAHEYAQLTPACRLTYCCNVYADGRLLSIVTASSSHGTHVACIAAACFTDDAAADKNGMAPGAQLVSVNIGDARLGTMETGTAIARAIAHVAAAADAGRYRVDLINMSYGEHSRWSDAGRLGQLANELVHRHGVLWCASAGNAGPALSTVGSPPDLPAALPGTIMGIGAYVTPPMMTACYGLRQPVPTATPYTWTSRDPSASSGGCYVSVCAPGCAITSVPNFTLQACEQMNGTSMASPNACGSLAVLLSCVRHLRLDYSVYSVRRSVEATAVPMSGAQADCFAMGCGMLRVDRALEHMRQYSRCLSPDASAAASVSAGAVLAGDDTRVAYRVTVVPGEAHGIYLRDSHDVRTRVVNKAVSVRCVFFDHERANKDELIAFQQRCALRCDASWVNTAEYVMCMNNSARSFEVRIDARSLPPGVHFTSVCGLDAECPQRGPLFRVPITVVVPCDPDTEPNCTAVTAVPYNAAKMAVTRTYTLHCGRVERLFIRVPQLVTSCSVSLRSLDTLAEHRFVMHALQCVPHCASNAAEFYKMLILAPSAEHREAFKVAGGYVLELALSKYWTNAGSAEVVVCVVFDGLHASAPTVISSSTAAAAVGCGQLVMSSSEVGRVDVANYVADSHLCSPSVTLKHHVCCYRPVSHRLSALLDDERDRPPQDRRMFALTLTYTFSVARSTEVVVQFKYLSELLYEAEFEGQLWMMFDSNKQFVCAGDAYPSKYAEKLDKGEYTVLLRIRHERKDVLDKMTELPLQVAQKLTTELKLDTYYKYNDALTGQRKVTPTVLKRGQTLPLYIAPLSLSSNNQRSSKVTLAPGHHLIGHLSLVSSHSINEKTGQFPFCYVVSHSGGGAGKSSTSASASTTATTSSTNNSSSDVKPSTSAGVGGGGALSGSSASSSTSASQHQQDEDRETSRAACLTAAISRADEYATALRHLQISWLSKLTTGDEHTAASVLSQVEASGGRVDVLSALASRLQAYDVTKEGDAVVIVELADRIIDKADRKDLLAFFGRKNAAHEDVKLKTEMDRERSALVEALCRKGGVLYECERRRAPVQLLSLATTANVHDLMTTALELAEPGDAKLVQLSIRHALLHERFGLAVRYQTRANDDVTVTSDDGERRLVELYERLGWSFVAEHVQRTRPARRPIGFRCF